MVKKIIIILTVLFSTYGIAQTTGPTQPEVTSFPSISGDGMVDLYTGNLNYNIPLLVVPGPEGGYPITLGYTASPSVNNVPTWVGYNWNINTGAIVRNKRGIPDDFRGDTDNPDILVKKVYQKDKWNIGTGISPTDMEIFGGDLGLTGQFSMYYDNYAGFGVTAGASLAPLHDCESNRMMSKGAWSLGVNFDSKQGIHLSPNLSLEHLLNKKQKETSEVIVEAKNKGFGKVIQNLQGKKDKLKRLFSPEVRKNFKFSSPVHAPLASIGVPRSTVSTEFAGTFDISIPVLKSKALTFKGNLSISKITEPIQYIPMYGSLYSQFGKDDKGGIMDSYRDNDMPPTKNTPFIPVTVNSVDLFSINASGLGGSFRLYRNEVGQYKPHFIETKATNVEIGADFGSSGSTTDLGVDLNFAHSKSYSGEWANNNRIRSLDGYRFSEKSVSKPLYEPAYFKLIGEGSPIPLQEYLDMHADRPIAFDIGNWQDTNKDVFSFKAKVFSTYNNGQNRLNVNNKNPRNPRTTSIEYKTREEVLNAINRNEGIYLEKYIISDGILKPIDYYNNKGKGHHINEIRVRKSNGSVYNFALPAYNTDEKNVVFATEKTDIDGNKRIPFTSQDASINNDNGDDNYFSEEVTPPYVHSYFLTSIQSLDYIDIKNDGFTDDDLGSWTKFIYTEVNNYHWRFPFNNNEANFIDGYNDNNEDNKATYTEGKKDLYYVTAIETKTHIAVFDIDNSALIDANSSNPQKYLKKISLYSKSDPNYKKDFYLDPNHKLNPIKEVHFNYDYSLKSTKSGPSTIPNFRAQSASSNNIIKPVGSDGQNGTLTLKELYFTYKNNQTGKDSRYQFEYNTVYNDTVRSFPVKYSEDRWGNYQPDIKLSGNINYSSYENPYTYQKDSKILRDENAGLWCLNKVTLPSNGTIEIDYEKDDYQYVQDKKALKYVRITGVGYSNGAFSDLSSDDALLSSIVGAYPDKLYIEASSIDEVKKRIAGIKNIGFKTFMYLNTTKKLKARSKKIFNDYVSGYLEKQNNIVGQDSYGYFIEISHVNPTNVALYEMHPFQVATIQYIRNYRPDLQESFEITSGDPVKFAKDNLVKLFDAIKPLFKGYIKDKAKKGWGSKIVKNKPSFLRLNSINRKFGGDNRVKQVKLFPDPSDREIYYGKEYAYVLSDGKTSSGVAEMEPITGHEENALVIPKWYQNETGKKVLYIQNETESSFVETPYGISFFPSANVGYSRVIERSLSDPDNKVTKTQDGITVTEFYTAKDYPTIANITENPFRSIIKPINVTIPFIGHLSINNGGFTQGAAFTINNAAYGKQKRISVYPYSEEEPNGEPVSEVEYVYKTNANNTLDNKVKFLKKEGDIVEAYLGKEYDFYLEQYENGSTTIGGGGRPDIKFVGIWPIPSLWPTFQYAENTSSYISTTKVIYNSPILEKTIQYRDGSKVISSPEYYDYETGNPIINSVTNEFDNKIYSYKFPAQWSYSRMKGAYKNYGAKLNIIYTSSTGLCELNPSQLVSNILFEGDEIVVTGQSNLALNKRYYVTNINPVTNKFELKDRENNNPNLPSFIAFIDRSGYRNLQSVNKGSIVSLEDNSSKDLANLVSNQNISNQEKLKYFIREYNISQPNFRSTVNGDIVNIGRVGMDFCSVDFIDVFYNSSKYGLYFSDSFNEQDIEKGCYFTPINEEEIINIDFSKLVFLPNSLNGNLVKMIYKDPTNANLNNQVFDFIYNNSNENVNCFTCKERKSIPVLQANAVEFSEDFTPNFNTLPSEDTDIVGESLTNIYQNNTANPYAFGVKGIPRSKRTWAYIESRQQEGTLGEGLRNDKDGEFDYFPFNWNESSIYNENYNWRWVNEITQYNANGNSEEGKNRLEMFSTNLFGYKNLLVTAAAQNAGHNDIVYDGFEDYGEPELVQQGTFSTLPTYSYRDLNHGNLEIPLKNNALTNISHTGDYGLIVETPKSISTSNPKYFKPSVKKYIISAWVYMGDVLGVKLNGGSIEVWDNTTNLLLSTISLDRTKNNIIDNWIKIEGEFEPSTLNSNIKIRLIPTLMSSGETASVFDDLRIQPFNSTMQTYVYDSEDYSLRYILNNQNYFSEFIRDSEGSLIQKNIETEEGKKTLSINRNNISNN